MDVTMVSMTKELLINLSSIRNAADAKHKHSAYLQKLSAWTEGDDILFNSNTIMFDVGQLGNNDNKSRRKSLPDAPTPKPDIPMNFHD